MRDGRRKTAFFYTLRGRLFLGMLLAALGAAAAAGGLSLLTGRTSRKEALRQALSHRMESCSRDTEALLDHLSQSTALLSLEVREKAERYLALEGLQLSDLEGSEEAVSGLEGTLFPLMLEEARKECCSGVFLILNAAEDAGSGTFRSGIFIRKKDADSTDGELLLYRGEAEPAEIFSLSKEKSWQQEFDTAALPFAFGESLLPSGKVCLSPMSALPGTSEKEVLLYAPLSLEDGTFLGVCGFALSEDCFRPALVQDDSRNTAALLAFGDGAEGVDPGQCFVSGEDPALSGTLSREDLGDGLYRYAEEGDAFVGMQESLSLSQDLGTLELGVLIPERVYQEACMQDLLGNALFLLLPAATAVLLSLLLSRIFAKPLLGSISDCREGTRSTSSVQEMDELSALLAERSQEFEKERKRLLTRQEASVDREQVELFAEGLKSLTPTEREIFDLYVRGLGTKEILARKGIRESTLRYHNRNLYSKLGVRSQKELLRCAAAMEEEKEEKEGV